MNLPTIIVVLAVALACGLIIRKNISDRKAGKSACACGMDCASCKGCNH